MSKPIINALLISAGYSGRMGDFKPLIKLNDKTFVSQITEKLLSVCQTVTIVTGFRNDDIEEEIRKTFQSENNDLASRVKCLFNPDYKDGMFSSVQVGLASMQNSDWVLFHFVDQPGIPQSFYEELAAQIEDKYDWIQPVCDMKEGHPVLFNNTIIPKVLECPPYYKMKLIRGADEVRKKYWFTDYKFILEDIDTPEDLEKFLEDQYPIPASRVTKL
jgi:molybdenum cofactor cytidylyltransferase